MSEYALKILSICPRSLLNKTFIRLLGAEKGVLLAELSGPISKNIAGWNRDEFTESEKEYLKEAYSYLKGRRAILDYKPTTEVNENEEEQTKVCRELLSQKTYLSNEEERSRFGKKHTVFRECACNNVDRTLNDVQRNITMQ